MDYKGSRKKDLQTLAVLAGALLVLYLGTRKPAFALLALGLMALGLVSGAAAARIAAAWMGFAEVLGRINSKVILGAVYFLILTPLALLLRLFSGNKVNTRADAAADTYFEAENRLFTAADLEKPW
jgi:hypothetical protein